MSEPNQSLEEFLFETALAKSSLEERASFLNGVCRDNPALRARLKVLLEGHFGAAGFLADGTNEIEQKASRPRTEGEAVSTVIGRYKLLERIGEGGFGEVWMAEQKEPVKRRVALKIIKLGMDTKQVVARFEAERQALALMDHPNIAKVLDAGATDTGRPYFVMELVRGIRITEYCDHHHLPTQERLKLFIQVCRAIQHAHQKGIIHRDIKPSNILVTLHDGVPVPKVIDFGIAKATQMELTEKTVFTQFHQFLGTPAYVSPEQAEISGLDIDTRSDIYSLGVLLYELLTGQTPFDSKELLAAGLDELRRRIREIEPMRPSTRLSGMTREELTTTAQRRGAEAPKLISLVRGDLDWIVMKCLEKDRARRYETANGLAQDIERHLSDEPVVARPPSRLYEFQKTVRRHWVGFAAVVAVLAVLAIGVVVSTFEAVRALRAEQEQSRLRIGEARQKSAAQQELYNSLVAQARATRLARQVGYRDKVFALLRQAKELDVPQKNLPDLRRQAVACLGDFVGLTPVDLTDFPTNIQTACLAPFGQSVAFALADGTIQLREMPQSTEVARLGYTNGIVWALRFSSTGEQLFAVVAPLVTNRMRSLAERRICAWARDTTGAWRETENRALPAATGELLCTEGGVFNVMLEFGSDRLVIASINSGGPAETAHLQVGDEIVGFAGVPVSDRLELSNLVEKCSGQASPIIVERSSHRVELTVTPAVDPGSRRSLLGIRLGNSKGMFRLFNVKTKAFVGCEVTHAWSPSNSMQFSVSGDGRWLAVDTGPPGAPSAHVISLYDWRSGGLSNRLDTGGPGALSLSEDGKYLAYLAGDGRIYSVPDLKSIGYFSAAPAVSRAVFCRNMAAVPVQQDNRIRIWNLPSREDVGVLEQPQNTSSLAFSSDGKALLAVGARQARFYLLSTPEKLNLPGCSDGVSKVAFSPDGTHLASVYGAGGVRVSDARTGRTLCETNDLPGPGHAVNYSPDGKWLAIGYWNSQLVSILDARTGQRLLELGTNGPGRTWSLKFSHDGRYFAAPTESLGLRIWTIQPGARAQVAREPDLRLVESWQGDTTWSKLGLEFAPDGRSLAYWSGGLWVWDFEKSSPPRVVAPTMAVGEECLNFTPDGHTLLAMRTNHVLVAVDVASGKQVVRHDANDAEPDSNGLCLSPDGSKLAVNSAIRSAVNIRDPKSGRLLYALPAEPGWRLWFVWSPDSRRLAVSRNNGNVAIWDLEKVNQILAQLGLSP